MTYRYDLIDVIVQDGVATATLDNPPINLMTMPLCGELILLGKQLIRTPEARASMRRFLEIGGQTYAGELRVAELCAEIASR